MRLFFIWYTLFWPAWVHGQEPVVYTHPNQVINLAYNAQYVEDEKGIISIEKLLHPTDSIRFRIVGNQAVNFGIDSSFFWVKSQLRNETDETLFLQVGNHALTDLLVYEMIGDQLVREYHSGNWMSFKKREVKDVDYLFPLAVEKGASSTIYIRVKHYRGTEFPLLAGSLPAIYGQAGNRHLMEGIYYGFMLLMVLYNLFIYFSLKDSSYLYYVAYIFLMGLLNATINGYAFRYFWPSAPWLTKYEDVVAALVGMSGILFASTFLNTKKNVPVFHKIFIGLFVGYIFIIGVIVSGNLMVGTIAVEILSLFLVASFFIAAYITLHKGYKPAKFFLIAWSLLLFSVIVFILEDYKILPYNDLTINSLQIGSAAEALLLSMALANRINVYKKETQLAQLETLHSLEENKKLITEQNIVLEKKVAERTTALEKANEELLTAMDNLKETQDQLIQKEKMASLGELTAGIAHEIQNPLNFVNNFSEINLELAAELKQGIGKLSLPDGQKEGIEAIVQNLEDNQAKIVHHGKRADAIVKGMLQHSRKSSGVKEAVDINSLAEEYLRLSYHGLRAKDKSFNASFSTELDEQIGLVEVIPQDMGRVLLNLFNNAFYAVNEKKKKGDNLFQPMVQLKTSKEGEIVKVSVRDNGDGIPLRLQDKIFQPFFTTKPTGEGTGLGLSLSYDIVTKGHGGELKLDTKEGEYTEFVIELPAQTGQGVS